MHEAQKCVPLCGHVRFLAMFWSIPLLRRNGPSKVHTQITLVLKLCFRLRKL